MIKSFSSTTARDWITKPMRYLLTIFATLALFNRSLSAAEPLSETPNFIVILTDDQSWVGSSVQIKPDDPRTRSDYYLTPHMERIARMGMRFTQGYSPAASCCPTRRALQTGQLPARHEYNADRKNWTDTYSEQLNIPRMLKAADDRYVTAHFGKWDHRYDDISPAQQGYDFSDGYTGNGTGGGKGSDGPASTPDPKRINTITDKSLHFIARNHHRKKGSSGKSGLLVVKSGHADFSEGVATPSSERRNQHVHQSLVSWVRDSGLPVPGHKVSQWWHDDSGGSGS